MIWNRLFKNKKNEQITQEIESIQKLEVKSGDVLLVRYSSCLHENSLRRLKDIFREVLHPLDVKIMVLEDGARVDILRKEKLLNE